MITRLRGLLLVKAPPNLVLEVGGVAFALEAPMTSIYDLPEPEAEVTLHTVLRFRDEQPELFGFTSIEQRQLFMHLIKVNGIGPRMALAILSGMTVTDFAESVRQGNADYLTTIPGIGKKTAQRLLLDMQDIVSTGALDVVSGDDTVQRQDSPESEAVSALVALGYNSREARSRVQAESGQGLSSQELIRAALKRSAR